MLVKKNSLIIKFTNQENFEITQKTEEIKMEPVIKPKMRGDFCT